MKNPWLSISWTDTIADVDKEYIIDKYNSVAAFEKKYAASGLDLQHCLPDPYSGNKDSKVYCLNMNPGEPDPCFYMDKAYEKLTQENLRHKVKDCFWAETLVGKCGKKHAGIDWLCKKMNKLIKELGRRPDIFFIEYFPYHSKKGFTFPNDLPSYEYSNELILDAIRKNKWIIIMRKETLWYKRIPALKGYKNLITLNSPAGGWLSPGNFSPTLTNKQIKKIF